MSSGSQVDYESGVFRWLLIGGLVLLLLVGVAICGVASLFLGGRAPVARDVSEEEKEAQVVMRNFIADVKAGNAKAAYAKTSKRFQAQKPPGDFQNQVGELAWIAGYKEKSLGVSPMHDKNFGGLMTLTGPENAEAKAEIEVVKENNVWKVDVFHAEKSD
jgi:hypothetical protein